MDQTHTPPSPAERSAAGDGSAASGGSTESFRTLDTQHAAGPLPATGPPLPGRTMQTGAAATMPISGRLRVPGYEILGELGRGGMGVVYQARHLKLNRVVALKMILAGGHAGRHDLERFQTEAEAVARLQHSGIVQIHEVGEHDGLPYFSLEFVAGGSLGGKLRGDPWPAGRAAEIVEQMARAMQHAHDHGVVHRDLKPGNVLLAVDGTPKITDFGLAKKLDEATGATQTGAVMGTPSYMAPEQARGHNRDVGPAADVYALGAVLYELLTGRPPFKGATVLDTLAQVVADEPVPPSRLAGKVPVDLETICLKCLRKEPGKRYGSAGELADDLGRFRAGEPIRARPVGVVERALKWVKRRPAVAALLFGLVLVATAGAAGILWKYFDAEEQRGRAEAKSAEATRAETSAKAEAARARIAEKEAKDQEGKATKEAIRATKAEEETRRELAYRESLLFSGNLLQAQLLWENGSVAAAREHLDDASKWKLRGWEYAHVRQRFDETHVTLRGHSGSVQHICFSPDGKLLASSSGDTAILWDTTTGKEVLSRRVRGMCFSPDGKPVTYGAEREGIKLRDAATGQEIVTLQRAGKHVYQLTFSPTGGRLAGICDYQTLKVWDAATGQELYTLQDRKGQLTAVAFSPDGKRLASAARDFHVRVWDPATGKELLSMPATPPQLAGLGGGAIRCVCFSPDSKRLVGAGEVQRVAVWDAANGKELISFKGHTDGALAVCFSPDGRTIASAGSGDNKVRVWDSRTGEEIWALQGHVDTVMAVCFSPDGKRLASGSSVRHSDDRSTGEIKLWDMAEGQDLFTVEGSQRGFREFCLSHDGKRVITADGEDGTVRVWDSFTAQELRAASGLDGRSLSVRADGRLASVGPEMTVKMWDTTTGKMLPPFKGFTNPITIVAFSPDGRRLAVVTNKPNDRMWRREIALWDVETAKQVIVLRATPAEVSTVCFSPDGKRLASGSGDGTLKVWDLAMGGELFSFEDHPYGVSNVCFSPDGKRLATTGVGSDTVPGVVKVRDAATGQELFALKGHTRGLTGVTFNPDSSRIVSASMDKTIKVWDAATGRELLTIRSPVSSTDLVFSRDGKRLFGLGDDGIVRVWEAAVGHDQASNDLAYLPRLNDDAALRRWHRAEAKDNEEKGQWFAAAFHLRQLIAAKEPDIRQLRNRLKRCEDRLKKL